ncbi:MAG: hypothetical protein ACRCZJ_00820 [Erysipelotrichaceae bacterium]
MKKLYLCLVCCMFLFGCTPQVEPEVEKLVLVPNAIYTIDNNPSNAQIETYNALTAALLDAGQETIAQEVARNFAFDFLDFASKSGKDDVGGISFIIPEKRGEFKGFATNNYYVDYQTIVTQYGMAALPKVNEVVVTSSEAGSFVFNEATYTGYTVRLRVTYEEVVNFDLARLKTQPVIQVILIEDVYYVLAMK